MTASPYPRLRPWIIKSQTCAGDYVDRGAWGIELMLALLAFKLASPTRVFLLRGNHESKNCTTYYGFQSEIKVKYEAKGFKVAKLVKAFTGACGSLACICAILTCLKSASNAGFNRSACVQTCSKTSRWLRAWESTHWLFMVDFGESHRVLKRRQECLGGERRESG
jgi:hypothetical protein